MQKVGGIQQRRYYRLRYPEDDRPLICIENQFFQVSETSERGLRVIMNDVDHLRRGMPLSGAIRLHDNREVEIEGIVLRFDHGEVIVKLEKGLSFKDMLSEQRYISQKYPLFFSRQTQTA